MQNLFDRYRFTASDGVDDTSVYPVNSGLRFRWERQDDGKFFREKLATELVFRGDDYTYFRGFFDDGTCTRVTLTIERRCSGTLQTWSERFVGVVPIFEGEWDFDRCEVRFRLVNDDIYECVNRNLNKKQNWLNLAAAVELKTIYGEFDYLDCPYNFGDFSLATYDGQYLFHKQCFTGVTDDYNDDTTPDPATAWRPFLHEQIVQPGAPPANVEIQTRWIRETVNYPGGPPPGEGWILLGGTTYVRPALYGGITENTFTDDDGFFVRQFSANTVVDPISNGRFFNDVFVAAVEALGCPIDEVVSNFFGINPDGTEPTNDAYDFAAANLQQVLIFQKSDVTNADATDDATVLELTLKEVLEALRDSLNVYWAIEDVGGTMTFRLEHLSYFDAANGLDITALGGGKYTAGMNAFKIEQETPYYEEFGYQESYTEGFTNKRIEYPADCATAPEIDRSTRSMNADVPGLINNANAGTSGFVFVCATEESAGVYQINRYNNEVNGAMQWRALHDNVWPFGRFRMDATSTASDDFAVQTIIKRKAQVPVTIPWCCEDFDPTELMQTGLGWGAVKDAEEDTLKATLTVNLLHE